MVDPTSVKATAQAALEALRRLITEIEEAEADQGTSAVPADQVNLPPETRDAKAQREAAAQQREANADQAAAQRKADAEASARKPTG